MTRPDLRTITEVAPLVERGALSPVELVRGCLDCIAARPAVKRGMSLRVEEASKVDMKDPKVQELLFKQRARAS